MKDTDAKRMKNSSDEKSNAHENREGQTTSLTKGASLGLLAWDTI